MNEEILSANLDAKSKELILVLKTKIIKGTIKIEDLEKFIAEKSDEKN